MSNSKLVDFKFENQIVTGTLIKRNKKTIIAYYGYATIKRHIFKHKVKFMEEKVIDVLINDKQLNLEKESSYVFDSGTNVPLCTDGISSKFWYIAGTSK